MIEHAVGDVSPARERRDDETGNSEAAQRVLRFHVRSPRRRDVIEEPAPLVEGDHENGRPPRRAPDDRAVRAREEGVAETDVTVRMVIRRRALVTAVARRIDEADFREASGAAVVEKS